VLVLFASRPLLDIASSKESSAQDSSLQVAYAGIFVAVLLTAWLRGDSRSWPVEGPNKYLALLLGLTVVAWAVGGLRTGADGFLRTTWGLLVALLVGPLFRTRDQIDAFIRTIFYSSILFLIVLAFNLQQGEYLDEVWRLGGQYRVPNALAAVTYPFFAYGLYVLGSTDSARGRVLNLSLLTLLGATIVLTQSRTDGGLMVISICFWLWMQGRRRLLYILGIPSAALAVASNVVFGWRLLSGFSPSADSSSELLELTGRAYLWAETWQTFASASLLHKLFGSGWGIVFENFSLSKMSEVSSITENSFLWLLVGAGAIGVLAYGAYLACAIYRSWKDSRSVFSKFERSLASLAFLAALAIVVEGATTDLVLSPIANGYLYAILSIFGFRAFRNRQPNMAQAAFHGEN